MVVMKFGGTSVGSDSRILEVTKIIRAEREGHPVVVVSAMSQVTNLLVELTELSANRQTTKAAKVIEQLRQLHHQTVQDLSLDTAAEKQLLDTLGTRFSELADSLNKISQEGLTPQLNDLVICFGERLSIHLVSAALQKIGLMAEAIEASELIVTDDNFGNARPLFEASRQKMRPRLQPLIDGQTVPVITGYLGATADGQLTTLGRGGSDYSATIIGHCLEAEAVWIWTDVDGVMTADPRLVKGAHTVKELSYDEAAELSYFGAKVLHPRTMVAAALSNTPVFIKNTLRPEATGTKISRQAYLHPDGAKAMTVLNDLSLITVQGKGMQGILGIAAKVFTTLANQKVNVLFISQASSENNISLVTQASDGPKAAQALQTAFQAELTAKNLETIQAESPMAMIAVVGEGLRNHIGIAGRIFSSLGQAGVNVIAIAQGSSERNISFVVSESDAGPALQAVHDELHLEKTKSQGVLA